MSTVLITGANRGIGLEMTKRYAAAGHSVIATARQPSKSDALNALAKSTGRVTVLALEVGDEASVDALAKALDGKPIDILINNAGALGGRGGWESREHDLKSWTEVLVTNVVGPYFVSRAVIPNLQKSKSGKLAIIASHLGSSELAKGGIYPYRASKAGAINLARNLAVDLKPLGIAVIAFHPGWVQTDMGGDGADITPTESAAGIRKVAADWTLETSGNFLKWNGEVHAW